MTDVLAVGLESWIIQDENYGDFQQGQRAAFALEFWALETFTISGAKQAPRSLRHIAGAQYEVSGQVVFSAARWWVIDAGVLLFCEERPPAEASPGGWLTGTIGIGIDPFFYFESLALQPDAPALIYDWEIDRIDIQTAPFVEVKPRYFVRDPARIGWRQVPGTYAWTDDRGHAEYLLHCHRLGGAPRRTLT